MSQLGQSHAQVVERGCALLGFAPIGPVAFVVLATRLRPAATLPGGHLVRLVADSKWLHIPLQVHQLQRCMAVHLPCNTHSLLSASLRTGHAASLLACVQRSML